MFGPGYGESIVVHLGYGDWLIVDSCLNELKKPAPTAYLEGLGVSLNNVKYVAVSHWHDDHTKGISKVVEQCSGARVGISSVFTLREAKQFVSAYSGLAAELSRGTKELYDVIKNHHKRIEPLSINRVALTGGGVDFSYAVTALSPTDGFFLSAQYYFLGSLPVLGGGSPLKEAPSFLPNNEAVAIHIKIGDLCILLGSDLETDHQGWTALVAHPEIQKLPKAEIYKVAHHGSLTAECPQVWDSLLVKERPISLLTPFNRGRKKLPSQEDRERIIGRSKQAHISSTRSTRAQMDSGLAKRLEKIGSAPVPLNAGYGMVRARRTITAPAEWSIDHFGNAGKL